MSNMILEVNASAQDTSFSYNSLWSFPGTSVLRRERGAIVRKGCVLGRGIFPSHVETTYLFNLIFLDSQYFCTLSDAYFDRYFASTFSDFFFRWLMYKFPFWFVYRRQVNQYLCQSLWMFTFLWKIFESCLATRSRSQYRRQNCQFRTSAVGCVIWWSCLRRIFGSEWSRDLTFFRFITLGSTS